MSNIDLAIAVNNLRDANNKLGKLSYELSLSRTSHEAVVLRLQVVQATNDTLRNTINNNSETMEALKKLLVEAQTQVCILQDEKSGLQESLVAANAIVNNQALRKPTKKGAKDV